MKKSILVLAGFILMTIAKAQTSNAILFTENGEKFTAILNGVRQNDKPETNVKITGLNAEFYKLKIIFDNTALGEKNFNLYVKLGSETTCSIKKNNKGEYVIRLVSEVPIAQAPPSTPQQTTLVYHTTQTQAPVETTTTQTTTTTTHGNTANPDNVNINMGMNVGGEGGNISINVSGTGMGIEEESHSTTVHSTTTTTTTQSSTNNYNAPPPPAFLPGYTGPVGCPVPMAPNEFADMKNAVQSKTFEDSRMTVAKQVLRDRCILASQVKELMLLFTFEEGRLDIAKYAYDHTYDIGNYFKVNDAFTFETSIDDLNTYIESRK